MAEGKGAKHSEFFRWPTTFGLQVAISVANQIVSSGANFALTVYLVRTLPTNEFGLFGISMAICLLYAGYGNALLLTQMIVHIPEKRDDDRAKYAASVFVLVVAFSLATLVMAGLLNLAFGRAEWYGKDSSELVLATTVVAVSSVLRNYFVRLVYSTKQEHKALAINALWALVLGLALFLMHARGALAHAAAALSVLAVANLAATVFGVWHVRLPLSTVSWRRARGDFREAFRGGRWASGGVGMTWLQSQSYMYVTAFAAGPSGVALANAARMLIAPFTFLLPALTQLLLPRLVELRVIDNDAMTRRGIRYSRTLVTLGVVYLILLAVGARYVIPMLVGHRYPFGEIWPVVGAWGLVLVFQLSKDGASLVMQASKDFRSLMLANTVTAFAGTVATVVLVMALGTSGAVLGVGVGEALLAAILWKKVQREK